MCLHCRVGSLEKGNIDVAALALLHCRVGSLENLQYRCRRRL
ncbi:hypothetical protein C4K17_5326 [Pseudomonas chlororaphis subsp. aurantiaca]|nr:hypothetical protein C4K17_5326 [Pseudomonas chlororaphis subsp. aurantiaca]